MNGQTALEYFVLAARLVIGGVFVYAGIGKILNPGDFAALVYQYYILPGFLVNLTAIFMPWLELIAGVFLIGGLWTRSAMFWINVLLLVFIAAISFNLARGLEFDCGCFIQDPDAAASSNPVVLLIRNSAMLAAGVLVQIRASRLLALDALFARTPVRSAAGA